MKGIYPLKELTTEELKQVELDTLIAIRDFCNAKGIKYFLCGGTLLGAVRHKGFIPWDDDIDIGMLREDYERFISEFDSSGRYKLITHVNNKEFRHPFAKLVDSQTVLEEQLVRSTSGMGVFVDIFPFDGLGDTLEGAKAIVKKARHNYHYGNFCQYYYYPLTKGPKKFLKNILIAYGFMSRKPYFDAIRRKGLKIPFKTSKYAGCPLGQYKEREILPREVFEDVVDVPFENETFSAPKGYEAYLTSLYKDYMQLPPEDKRVTHHSFKVYWKE